ncbi:nuclear transport factor 2 family protein [Ichthyenterobacterium sp. W332]|uniref:Nuclear transport factor 2 family protein n=1 Tax=Microcosmobacter mediterraneus TaxID=3075607 RepID=A0ABU2YL41_9FLAO|nr:nuclear transport factor 2 family protein [Ichthyenterobacterium sp. W332]MDT0558875.1 nuclear transport factor 2 family protein [Ichthyenterobacterium sp. W332]
MKNVIEKFYEAFNNKDAKTMISFYNDDIVFKDPAFGTLKGEQAKNMWLMLCQSQKNNDFKVTVSNIKYAKNEATAQWEAFYIFSKTGRKVHNKINGHFIFKDNTIISHIDDFNLHKWAKQALGFKGWLLGGTSFFKDKLQKQTNTLLKTFEKNQR